MKKAYIVTFSVMTRVIVDSDDDDTIIEAAVDKLLLDPGMMRDKLLEGGEDIEEDYECPYETFEEDMNA